MNRRSGSGAADRRNRDEDQVQGRVSGRTEPRRLVLLRGDGNRPTCSGGGRRPRHARHPCHPGDDHLINAARQKQIYDALEWNIRACPTFPDPWPDGSKLSKRHGRWGGCLPRMGYLPAALRNYWSARMSMATRDILTRNDRRLRSAAIGRVAALVRFRKLENSTATISVTPTIDPRGMFEGRADMQSA